MTSAPIVYNEQELLKLIAAGDGAAFRQLFDHYRNSVYAAARRTIKSDTLAEDIVQEVFLKIWLNKDKLTVVENFGAYLTIVARNHIYKSLQRTAAEQQQLHSFIKTILPQEPEAFNNLSLRELQQILQKTIETLSPQQQKVFRLSRLEGYKHEEIANTLNLSKETVKKYLMDALTKVRQQLTDHGKATILLVILELYHIQ